MATVTGITAAKAADILGQSVVSGVVNGSGRLILTRSNGSTFDGGDFLTSVQAAQAAAIATAVAAEVANKVAGTKVDLGDVTGSISFASVNASTLLNALFTAKLVGNITVNVANLPASPRPNTQFAMRLTQDATGGRTLTLTGFKKSQGVLSLTPAANAVDIVVFLFDGTTWFAGLMGVDFK